MGYGPVSGGGGPSPSSSTPALATVPGAVGTATTYARGDHAHPGPTALARGIANPLPLATGGTTAHIIAANPSSFAGIVSLPANTAQVGDKIQFRVTGTYNQAAVTASQPIVIPKLGGQALWTAGTSPTLATGAYNFILEADFVVTTAGASGKVFGYANIRFIDQASGVFIGGGGSNGSFITLDFTSAKAVEVDFNAADPGSAAGSQISLEFLEVVYTPKP